MAQVPGYLYQVQANSGLGGVVQYKKLVAMVWDGAVDYRPQSDDNQWSRGCQGKDP